MVPIALRRRLILLAAAASVPLALVSGIGIVNLVREQRTQSEQASLELSRALATGVQGELERSVSVLQTMAADSALQYNDLRRFHASARAILQAQSSRWITVLVSGRDETVLLNAGRDFDAPPLPVAQAESLRRVQRVGQPVVGALARGPGGHWGVPVRVPVFEGGALRYVLTAVVKPDAFLDVISRQGADDGSVVSVIDSAGLRVARSRAHAASVGQPPTPGLQALLAGGAERGSGVSQALEGEAVYTSFTRLPAYGWAVAIAVPRHAVRAAGDRSLIVYGSGLLLSLALGAIATFFVARGINRPMAQLREAAKALGRSAEVVPPRTPIREIDEVGRALVDAARHRAGHEAEREALLAAERWAQANGEQARQRLELLVAAGSALSQSLAARDTLRAVAQVLVPGLVDGCRIDVLDGEGALQRTLTRLPEGADAAWPVLDADAATPGSMAWAAATGGMLGSDGPGIGPSQVLPLRAHGRTLGALAALRLPGRLAFDAQESALLAELAQRAALALDHARLYAEAEGALRDAERAHRAKDEFMAMLGHELRNPLAPIVTALYVMERREPMAAPKERRIIERQVRHLSRLVDDLLDVARITEGKIDLQRQRVDLREVVHTALELTEPAFARRAQPIELELPAQPLPVDGDPVRLAQVLSNLLINADKFTPRDRRVALRALERDGQAELVLEDEGAGITAELLPQVFNLFQQAAQPIERHSGGLGLGLAIVRALVELHGGSVGAASEGAGRGSRFVVRLPLAAGPPPHVEAARPPQVVTARSPQAGAGPATRAKAAPRGGRLLVVEDHPDTAQTLRMLLADEGYEVRAVSDGAAALALLEHWMPQLALLDIGLPSMDGHELARRLRADPRCAALRLVALSGFGRAADRERALASVFDEHLVKPARPAQLVAVLGRLLREPGFSPARGEPA